MSLKMKVRNVLCVLLLALCCLCGCVRANPPDPQQTAVEPGAVPGRSDFRVPVLQGSHTSQISTPVRLCPENGGQESSGGTNPPCIPRYNATRSPVVAPSTAKAHPGNSLKTAYRELTHQVTPGNADGRGGLGVGAGTVAASAYPFPGTSFKSEPNAAVNSGVPGKPNIVYGGPDMAGIILPKSTASSDLNTRGTSDVVVAANPQKAPNEVIATQGNLSRVKEHMSQHGSEVNGNNLGSHPGPVFSCTKKGHSCDGPGIPGNVIPTPSPTSPGSHPGVGDGVVPGFPGVHPNVTLGPPHDNVTVGPPSFARNRRSGPIPPPPIPEVSQSGGEASGPTNTQHEQNDNQERNTAAAAHSESAASTRNTPTKVTPPAMPTTLQPPMPAKRENKLPPKKRKADSSSTSSVWVRVPLLIVAVLFSATVY